MTTELWWRNDALHTATYWRPVSCAATIAAARLDHERSILRLARGRVIEWLRNPVPGGAIAGLNGPCPVVAEHDVSTNRVPGSDRDRSPLAAPLRTHHRVGDR